MKNNLDLLSQFTRIEWQLHRYYHQNHRDHGPMGDTHRGQGRILALLNLKPDISQKELFNILDMRSQSLGELLAKLERSGYITRTPSKTDGRIMDIRLTQTGKEASGQKEQRLDTEISFECLNEEEQSNLSDYLNRIIDELERQFGGSESNPRFNGHQHFQGGYHDRRPDMHDHQHFHGEDHDHRPDMHNHDNDDDENNNKIHQEHHRMPMEEYEGFPSRPNYSDSTFDDSHCRNNEDHRNDRGHGSI